MDLAYIYKTFKELRTNKEKIEYLQQLQALNLPYSINYTNLIQYYRSKA